MSIEKNESYSNPKIKEGADPTLREIIRSKIPGIPPADLDNVLVDAYRILMTETRINNWGYGLKRLQETEEEQLILAMLNKPAGYGIERKAVYTHSDYLPNAIDSRGNHRGKNIAGQVFRGEGKPFFCRFFWRCSN